MEKAAILPASLDAEPTVKIGVTMADVPARAGREAGRLPRFYDITVLYPVTTSLESSILHGVTARLRGYIPGPRIAVVGLEDGTVRLAVHAILYSQTRPSPGIAVVETTTVTRYVVGEEAIHMGLL